MFIRVRHWTTEPGSWDRFVGRLEHEGLAAMRATKGFQRLVVTGDPMSNSVVTVSFWESEAAERVYEVEKAREFAVVVEGLVEGAPETFAYPVVYDSAG
ncbi:MAG: hypothetical protein EA356_06855 [Geminicoccaceae bacterium]|nr:MAG: hypothetical protein EA356_06855 [Geminicoccaceae bacterium]